MHNGLIREFDRVKRDLVLQIDPDGAHLWAFRYSSEGKSRSLYASTDEVTLRQMYPDNALLASLSPETRLVVSEPLGDLPGAWHQVPEASYVTAHAGADACEPFVPAL